MKNEYVPTRKGNIAICRGCEKPSKPMGIVTVSQELRESGKIHRSREAAKMHLVAIIAINTQGKSK